MLLSLLLKTEPNLLSTINNSINNSNNSNMDSNKLELFKNKEEHAQSAIASQEVREHLAGFIRSKRLGSNTQISQQQTTRQQQLQQSSGTTNGTSLDGNNNIRDRHLLAGQSSYGPQDDVRMSDSIGGNIAAGTATSSQDDHPLRKTASMPAISYKAQSSSRRRQVERRTTVSPLTKRRSQPRRQLLHSLDSADSAEYMSNPCIIQANLRSKIRSLSQSSSPPPSGRMTSSDCVASNSNNINNNKRGSSKLVRNGSGIGQSANVTASSLSQSDIVVLGGGDSGKDDVDIRQQYGSVNSSNTSLVAASSNSQPQQQQQQQTAIDMIRQQQHLKVNEAIRKTVMQRATSRTRKMSHVGGSLDIDSLKCYGSRNLSSLVNDGTGSCTGTGQFDSNSNNIAHSHHEQLRQRSLDVADLRANTSGLAKLAATNPCPSGLYVRNFEKLRLATTNDAASLRRSQSPSSSISMGVSCGRSSMLQQQQQQQPAHQNTMPMHLNRDARPAMTAAARIKHFSSSSSSTSSLLSQQDSLEDSAAQAIDLSGSSEICWQRADLKQQQQQNNVPQYNLAAGAQQHRPAHGNLVANHILNSSGSNQQSASSSQSRLNYQKVLQESFNQLQLCQHSHDGIKQLMQQNQTQQQQESQSQSHQQQLKLHDSIELTGAINTLNIGPQAGGTSNSPYINPLRIGTSLDLPNYGLNSQTGNHNLLTSLPNQYNLMASLQNLIEIQDQQAQQQQQQMTDNLAGGQLRKTTNSAALPPQQDIDALLRSYNNNSNNNNNNLGQTCEMSLFSLAARNLAGEAGGNLGDGSNQPANLTLARIAALNEPYKSIVLNQLIHQKRCQLNFLNAAAVAEQHNLESNRSIGVENTNADQISTAAGQLYQHQSTVAPIDHKTIISRALSSPLLISQALSNDLITPMNTSDDNETTTSATATTTANTNNNHQRINMHQHPLYSKGSIGAPHHPHEHHIHPHHPHQIDRQSSSTTLDRAAQFKRQNAQLINFQRETLAATATKRSASSTSRNPMLLSSSGEEDLAIFGDHSIDLTLGSKISSKEDKNIDRDNGSNNISNNKTTNEKTSNALSFNYTPIDPIRASCNFIYNPIFDQNSSTGLIYEVEMCNHRCICGNENNHPENSYRILAIWRRLFEKGLMAKFARIEGRKATMEELRLCHSETYTNYFGKSPYERIKVSNLDLSKLPIEGLTQLECGGQGADIDTAWNEVQTPGVARLAAGCVIEAASNVADGKLLNAFAVVRPPGHHAEHQQAMGFCFFNSVAIAARVLTVQHKLKRILIIDWDVHHGNGIQRMFYEDDNIMYISMHRHDRGNFFPGTGDTREIGSAKGEGYNWNIAWSNESMGDAEYLAAFRCIVMPIARDFNPSMILVACGFDAARGHPFNFGGYDLSSACFAHMTRQLMTLANGRLVLCLEGGYQLNSICDCAEACARALLNDCTNSKTSEGQSDVCRLSKVELRREPNQSACETLIEVSNLAARYWPSVIKWRHTIEMSALNYVDEF